jgi:predicted Zn-dependent peptidase
MDFSCFQPRFLSQTFLQAFLQTVLRAWLPLRSLIALCLAILIWLTAPAAGLAQSGGIQPYINRVMRQITEFQLGNGMKFIVMERHQSPTISFMTYVNVGSAYEQSGKTGAAHFLEHLAFKGTTQIGTQNYKSEKPLLDQLDRLFQQLKAAKAAGQTQQVVQLQRQFDQEKVKAAALVRQNEFGQIVQQAGGVGLNATTSADATRYFYSFPSNKLELWMSLESERFLQPVFREFFEEKNVILEERRMRTDNSPIGRLVESFLEAALPNHPYGRPVIGYETDLRNLAPSDVRQLYDSYYTPNHIIIGIAGDVNPKQVKQLAEAYFGRYQSQSQSVDIKVTASAQTQPRSITVNVPAEPWYMEGYQRPAITDPDNAVYQMIASILTGGRTSRLYRSLVEQQLALSTSVSATFPGDRYSNLMLLYAQTAPGHTIEQIATVINAELNRLKTEPVSAAELDQVKTQARASLLVSLNSNQGMASLLPEYEAKTGSWRHLFEELKQIDAVTAADVQRVAKQLFQPQNQTVGKLLAGSG